MSFGEIDQFTADGVNPYEEMLKADRSNGSKIKALILSHPHNPLGRCYTPDALIAFMGLCQNYKVHLIVDEVYALSVFHVPDPKAVKFQSVLSVETEQYIQPDYLHLLYGMSKDTAAGGIRLGCFYSRNRELMRAMSTITHFHWSGIADEKIAISMLEDESWMDSFLQKSQDRLADNNVKVRTMLDNHGIKYSLESNAGFFLWVDRRPFLPASSDSCQDRWDAEAQLLDRLSQNQVYMTAGKAMYAEEPGWFRLIFSIDERIVEEGLRR